MLTLDDPKWKEFEGGYRIQYDASIALRSLEQASTPKEIESIFAELWEELHHQGDVGLASYYAVPHLVRIAKEKRLFDFNVFGLVARLKSSVIGTILHCQRKSKENIYEHCRRGYLNW